MNYVRYRLQPYSGMQSRHRCPVCNHRTKTFKRYISPDTGECLAPHVGLCDRVLNCGYHFTPRQYFASQGHPPNGRLNWQRCTKPLHAKVIQPHYIAISEVNASLENYHNNHFVLYLVDTLGLNQADALVKQYRIGTSTRWPGATIFWQIDAACRVRTGKIMLYNRQTGKRVKKPYNHITWVHTQNGKTNFNLKQCLFGEHLLPVFPHQPVAIVESEKTAVIASALMPAFIWLTSGSLDGLNTEKCRALQYRQVMLFPDANGYNKWKAQANALQQTIPGATIAVSSLLEKIATEADRIKGADLSDVILNTPSGQ